MGRVIVIGDVGGHPDQLRWALTGIGAYGEPLVLPDDVVVVQVGDLVDRGPDSLGVLELVAGIMDRQPEQWVQLLGNHEWQYLPEGELFWPRLPAACRQLLVSWWDSGAMNVAAAVAADDGSEWLLTHAGLTVGCWRELDEPMTASSAAWLLNDRPEIALRDGLSATPGPAGPLWAQAGTELYEPWLEYHARGGLVPFGQIHGHSAIVRYEDQTWRSPGRVRQRASVDWVTRQVRVRIGGRVFIGVDPKHDVDAAPTWQPLILNDATRLTPSTTGRR